MLKYGWLEVQNLLLTRPISTAMALHCSTLASLPHTHTHSSHRIESSLEEGGGGGGVNKDHTPPYSTPTPAPSPPCICIYLLHYTTQREGETRIPICISGQRFFSCCYEDFHYSFKQTNHLNIIGVR